MALKFRITTKAYEGLSDELKAEYVADGDKHYKLEVTGIEEPAELRRAKERAEGERDDLFAEIKELRNENKKLKDADTDDKKDVRRLEERHQRKLTTLTEEKDAKIASRDSYIKSLLVDNTAIGLAKEISTVPTLLADVLKKRMDVDFEGDEPKLVIKDKDGKPDPALTVDKLKSEVVANPEFKSILVANKATGSAAQKGSLPAGGATPAQDGAVNVNTLDKGSFVERVKARVEAKHGAQGANAG